MGHLIKPVSKPIHEAIDPRGLSSYRDLPAFGLLQHAAEQIPDHTAIVYHEQTWTFDQLNNAAIRAAAMLQRLGVQPGDRIGILLPNVPEYIIAANAIWRAGGVAVAISPLMVDTEVAELLRKTDCRIVVCLDLLSHIVPDDDDSDVTSLLVSIRQHLPSLHQIGYLWARHRRTGHWTLPSRPRSRWFWEEVDATDRGWQPISIDVATEPAYILPTGGTTGSPKAVTLSHTNMVANAWQQYQWTGGSFATETMMAVLPFFHSYGMSAIIMGGAALGAKLIMHHRFNTRQVIQMIEEHRPSVFHAVPAMLVAMNERFATRPPKIEGMRWVISGGAPLDGLVGATFAEYSGALVVEGYGLSEASPVTHVGSLFDEPHYGTIGLPLPDTDCRIIDASDECNSYTPLPDGEVGEIIVRGPQIMLGYWQEPDATRQAIRNGWLHTGDLAIRGEDGLYRIVGRKKDLIITSGFNVYPSEVEDALRLMDGVADAAVVGQPDPRRGETVMAHIVLEPGVAWDESAIRDHCATHLAKYKQPRIFQQCVGDLPRNFLGKVIRRELRESSAEVTNKEME